MLWEEEQTGSLPSFLTGVFLLDLLETRRSEQVKTHFLSYHIFLTGWDENQVLIRL
jgi:hypothetical protein